MSIERSVHTNPTLTLWEPPTLMEVIHSGPFTAKDVETYGRYRDQGDPSVRALGVVLGGGLDALAQAVTRTEVPPYILPSGHHIRFGFFNSKADHGLDAAAVVARPTGRTMQPEDHLLALTVCRLEEPGIFAVDAHYVGMRQPTTPDMQGAKRTQRETSPHFQTALAMTGYYEHGDHEHSESTFPYPHDVVDATLKLIRERGVRVDLSNRESVAHARGLLDEAIQAYSRQ